MNQLIIADYPKSRWRPIFRYRLSFERRLSKYLGVNHIAFPEEIIRKKLIKIVENFYPNSIRLYFCPNIYICVDYTKKTNK